jgi:hypothetical protein
MCCSWSRTCVLWAAAQCIEAHARMPNKFQYVSLDVCKVMTKQQVITNNSNHSLSEFRRWCRYEAESLDYRVTYDLPNNTSHAELVIPRIQPE